MKGKKAEMGIGTLILFIAMILVAAVAAGVLLSTAIGLQSKALLTGKRTKDKVATELQPIIIYAKDGSDSNVEKFYMHLQLAPGSQPIKYAEMLVVMSTKNDTVEMSWNKTANCSTLPPVGQYAVEEILNDSSSSTANYLARGEVAKVCFQYKRSINEDESVVLQLLPKVGNPIILDLTMPSIINKMSVVLYP